MDIARSYRTARFSRLLGIMIETGISAPVAIRLICDTVDRDTGATGLAERASDAVRQGQRLSVALELPRRPWSAGAAMAGADLLEAWEAARAGGTLSLRDTSSMRGGADA